MTREVRHLDSSEVVVPSSWHHEFIAWTTRGVKKKIESGAEPLDHRCVELFVNAGDSRWAGMSGIERFRTQLP
jgi:hypothetical protein